jgi:hypothetical protein
MMRDERRHECLNRLPTGDVDVHDVHTARVTIGRDLPRDIASFGLTPAREHQVRAEPTKLNRDLPADS